MPPASLRFATVVMFIFTTFPSVSAYLCPNSFFPSFAKSRNIARPECLPFHSFIRLATETQLIHLSSGSTISGLTKHKLFSLQCQLFRRYSLPPSIVQNFLLSRSRHRRRLQSHALILPGGVSCLANQSPLLSLILRPPVMMLFCWL